MNAVQLHPNFAVLGINTPPVSFGMPGSRKPAAGLLVHPSPDLLQKGRTTVPENSLSRITVMCWVRKAESQNGILRSFLLMAFSLLPPDHWLCLLSPAGTDSHDAMASGDRQCKVPAEHLSDRSSLDMTPGNPLPCSSLTLPDISQLRLYQQEKQRYLHSKCFAFCLKFWLFWTIHK